MPYFFLMLIAFSANLWASPHIDLGLHMGVLSPKDTKFRETFRQDFYLHGILGIYDKPTGWELRGNLGHYSTGSIFPADAGKGGRLDVTPLTGSLLYHMGGAEAAIQPYIGGGAGVYFYGWKEDVYGTLDSGSRFAPHILGGIKVNLSPNMYIGFEYTRTFASPVFTSIISNTKSFDLDMLTIGISILSNTTGTQKTTQANTYDTLLLTQINDTTAEIQKIKENRTTIEKRIDTFYEKAALQETASLFDTLERAVGSMLTITHPQTEALLAEGLIDSITTTDGAIALSLRNDQGWQLPIVIPKERTSVRIGGKEQKLPDIKKAVQVSIVREDQEFVRELRRVQYLETRLISINKTLAEAETQLAKLHKQWQETRPKDTPIQVDRYITTPPPIIHHVYDDPHDRPYRYYRPQDYVAPVYVPVTPPSTEERERFLQAKKERLEEMKR